MSCNKYFINMKFEESKEFELTKREEGMVKRFAKEYGKVIRGYSSWGMPSTFAVEEIVERVVDELGGGLWFFGKALNEVSSMLVRRNPGEFEKTLVSDRSVVRFGLGELEERLFDIGRYYFGRTFDHGYERLRDVSKCWVDLDDYVKGREGELGMDGVVRRLPELEGMF
jgi:hypothetical protein